MILGASRYYALCIRSAKELGLNVVVTDRNRNAEGIRYADFFEAVDITDIPGSVGVAKKYRIDGVIPLNDFGVQTASAISETLCLPGISRETAMIATDKAWMRRIWEQVGVPSAQYRVVDTVEGAFEAAVEIGGWPIIVKPVDSRGGGSRGVSRVDHGNELGGAFDFAKEFYPESQVIVEEYLQGTEHSLETITVEGKTHVLAVSDKEKTLPPYRVDKSVIYPTIKKEKDLKAICETARKAIQALGITQGPAHVELCFTETGPKLFEIGARCGGGGTASTIVPFVSGIDMFKEICRIAVGKIPSNLVPVRRNGCVYRFLTPPSGRLEDVEHLEEVRSWNNILDCGLIVKPGGTISPVRTGLDRAAFVIAGGQTREAAMNLADRAENRVRFLVAQNTS